MNARERVSALVDGGAFTEMMPSPHAQHFFGSGTVGGRKIYAVVTDEKPPQPFPKAPPQSPMADQPNPRFYTHEARRWNEFLEAVQATPHPVVYLAASWQPPVHSNFMFPGLDMGFHPTHAFGAYMKKLARLDVPKVAAVFSNVLAAQALMVAHFDAVVGVRGANVAMFHPRATKRFTGVDEDPSYATVEWQWKAGSIDSVVDEDAEAIAWVKKYLRTLDRSGEWKPGQQRYADVFSPASRLAFPVKKVIEELVDEGTFVELRGGWGAEIVTCLGRLAGRPVGVIAHNSKHMAGAVRSEGARKIALMASLCDRYGIPMVFLVDADSIAIGSAAESTGLFRFAGEAMMAVSRADVPKITVVLRRGTTGGLNTMAGRGIGDRLLAFAGSSPGMGPLVRAAQGMLAAGQLSDDEKFALQDAIASTSLERLLEKSFIDGIVRDGDLRGAILAAIDDVDPSLKTRAPAW